MDSIKKTHRFYS